MSKIRTLGGVPCSPRCSFFMDDCTNCQGTFFYINDHKIYDTCRCARPVYKRTKGVAHVAVSAEVVDALAVLFDDEAAPDDKKPVPDQGAGK